MLPSNSQLDINALTRIFDSTTNSYKHLFFIALLELIKENAFDPDCSICINDVTQRMLLLALYPNLYFKLNFGPMDMMQQHINSVGLAQFDTSSVSNKSLVTAKKIIAKNYCNSSAVDLQKYVPYRLLQPFFTKELKGLPDQHKNVRTVELAKNSFEEHKPLYRFETSHNDIKLNFHPLWLEYFEKNHQIVSSWSELNWVKFLQRRNPNTPSITNKIYPPLKRESLSTHRKFWDDYITEFGLKCIFTGKSLATGDYDLDHFIPWSYVGHNQHWNLIPIDSATNSSKSDSLPHKDYVLPFSVVQKKAALFAIQRNKKAIIEDHMVGLQCSKNELINYSSHLEGKLHKTLESLLDMASLQGFESNWRA